MLLRRDRLDMTAKSAAFPTGGTCKTTGLPLRCSLHKRARAGGARPRGLRASPSAVFK